ncbi:YegS/Rv2252/BmrU family lipid kinase [Corallococcus praedator]|uniref:YegS/Rv2252/BmrU family lipid kinase n=1 Tax=Corallococcus praedator TaxID=2316724 RepID=A0ABX9QBE9_9BACT|nr:MULTISPECIES: YegS/Rv2252/BmrU family lipid kinase [Corallococcus]RKH18501.1 YegS/Rv2252/BmrU family lipid kinase [Corallococcus sp. CA047B]RKH31689.1 YegS/Rv2252/BmrU family lipid kinase [Corallococcus sp. CA031C]RKH98379.1 YegS/Rv2252/BmrU family lipid kinase [Corallococcus praedator]
MKTFLVVNPRSANGQTGKRWVEISAQVGRVLGEFGHGFTSGGMDAARLARQAIDDGYECIVAVGGDGTLNEVTNGFFRDGKVINPRAALGLVPRGTGGDFRRTFGWDLELTSALERLRTEKTEPFDVGRLDFIDNDGQPATRFFANIASFGVSAVVAREVNAGSKALGGHMSFMWGTVKGLVKYTERQVRLTLDDKPPETVSVTTVAVANGRYFGSGMFVAPDALTHDGLFDITLWSNYKLSDFVLKSKGVYNGDHVTWKGTRRFQCRTLHAESETGDVFLDVDGETPGRLPCTMTILPGAIRLKV